MLYYPYEWECDAISGYVFYQSVKMVERDIAIVPLVRCSWKYLMKKRTRRLFVFGTSFGEWRNFASCSKFIPGTRVQGIQFKKREKTQKHQFLLQKSQKHHFWIDILFLCILMTTSISNFQRFSSSFQIFFSINDNFTNLWNHIYFPLLIVKIFCSCHCCTFTGNAHTMYTHMFFCVHLPTQYFFASYDCSFSHRCYSFFEWSCTA